MNRSVLARSVLLLAASCATAPAAPPPPPPPPAAAAQAGAVDAAFRAQPPAPGRPVEFHAPVPRTFTLANGLRVFFVERHEVPLVSVRLAVRSGLDSDPRGKAGLASFAISLLDEGTTSRDSAAIARGFEDLGARYLAETRVDSSSVSLTVIPSALAPALDLFSDVVLHPAFRPADVERIRVERLGQLSQERADPAVAAQHVLQRLVFGPRHPWGSPLHGTPRSLQGLKPRDLARWHRGAFQPANAAIFVVGDTDDATVRRLLEAGFGAWKASGAARPVPRALPAAGARVVTVVDKPGAPQSQILLGEVGVSSKAPDVFAVNVMNNVLGGSFNSRLNGNLRTEHAYSYGAFSVFDSHREPGVFVAGAGVVADKTAEALGEFFKELRRMQGGEVTDLELADARESLIHALPALFLRNESTAGALAQAWANDLPADYYATYQARVQAVSKADVARAAREHLHPDRLAIVVVGPQAALAGKAEGLGLGAVELRDSDGERIGTGK